MLRCIAVLFALLPPFASCAGQGPYLAAGTWPDDDTAWYEDWYGEHLAAMREPSLAGGAETTTIRLLYLPSFGTPEAVRLTSLPDGSMALDYKVTTGRGGYGAGWLARSEKGTVPPDRASRLLSAVEHMGVWSGRVPLETRDPDQAWTDGTQVFLEFARQGTWVPVSRHECDMAPYDPLRLVIAEMGAASGHPFPVCDYFR